MFNSTVHDAPVRASRIKAHLSATLVAAFALSAAHTTDGWLSGIGDPRFTVSTPIAWLFYAIGFGSALVARSARRSAQWAVTIYVTALLVLAVFWYPTTFTSRQQTTFGWFENDVYTGLLMLALYLCVQGLRGIKLT